MTAMIDDVAAYVQRVYQTFPNETGEWIATNVERHHIPSKNQHIVGFALANPIIKITETSKSEIVIEVFYTPHYSLELDETVLRRASPKRTVQVIVEAQTITLFFDKGHSTRCPTTRGLVEALVHNNLLLDNFEDE
jgi:hypothetical protein